MCCSRVLSFCLLVLSCGFCVESARILGVFPFIAKSHFFVGNSLMKELARRGHDVTVISPFEDIPANVSYRNIKLVFNLSDEEKNISFFKHNSNPYLLTFFMNWAGSKVANLVFNMPAVQELLKSGEKFDAVIMDQFADDAFAYFAHHFEANHILLSSSIASSWVNPLVGNPAPPSVNPEILLEFGAPMGCLERFYNTLFYMFTSLNKYWFLWAQNSVISSNFPNAKPLYDYLYNASLVLVNAHESYSDPIPMVPAMKNVGGMHVGPPGKLPDHLQEFMDSAKHGVIYFSMGSNLKSKDLPESTRESILRVFSKFNQKVLWKFDGESLPKQPKNVKVGKWFPQQDILAHPNLKLFITHGGLLSTIEAVHYGVPLLTIPVYGDQHQNALVAHRKGYAINIPYKKFEEGLFEAAVFELLQNYTYKRNAVARSKLYHDRPMKPMDEAIYWVEYVIRNKGTKHFRVAALDLYWYEYILIDVFVLIWLCLSVGKYAAIAICRKCCCKKRPKMSTARTVTKRKQK